MLKGFGEKFAVPLFSFFGGHIAHQTIVFISGYVAHQPNRFFKLLFSIGLVVWQFGNPIGEKQLSALSAVRKHYTATVST